MILLDTDILGLFFAGNPKVVARVLAEEDQVATTEVTRIEILRGRFDFVMKAANGKELVRAQELLTQSAIDLSKFPVVPITPSVAAVFDDLRSQRGLRKIGRADLLIAAIALAHKSLLVTRNIRHFERISKLKIENWAD